MGAGNERQLGWFPLELIKRTLSSAPLIEGMATPPSPFHHD